MIDDVLPSNPVAHVSRIEGGRRPVGAPALDAAQIRLLLGNLRSSQACLNADLADPITMLAATGLRRSELLALRWVDYDEVAATITVCGKVARIAGKGLTRLDSGKTSSSDRVVPLPGFATEMLTARRSRDFWGHHPMIFPSTMATWRDPDNFDKQWRRVRDDLGFPTVTSHSFRKSLATMIDDAGMSARVGADQLGHAKVSMTQDIYMRRGKVHAEVAALLDRVVSGE